MKLGFVIMQHDAQHLFMSRERGEHAAKYKWNPRVSDSVSTYVHQIIFSE